MPYAVVLFSCIGLLFSVLGLHTSTLQYFDHLIVAWINSKHSNLLTGIAQILSIMGGLPALLLYSSILAIHLKKSQRTVLIPLVIAAVIGSTSIGWLIKWLINRPRPELSYALVESYGASFPSAHSVYAATLASLCILIWHQHVYARVVMLLASLWWIGMGISRVYLGVHYPTDVLAGWSLGFLWIAILWLLLPQVKLLKNKYFSL